MDAPIPPQATPQTNDQMIDWIRLIRSRRVGPATFLRLIRQFGTASAALQALPDIAAGAGVTGYQSSSRTDAAAELQRATALGAQPLCLGAPAYPKMLHELPDVPPLLWALGDLALVQRPTVAIVGARNASAVGKRMATALARDLGELGYVVISGLARGIDAAAHEAALTHGTIAVQAGGIDVIYPKENADLTLKIAESGLRLSERPPGMTPQARHFPSRNRIIAGLAQAIVVVEGASRSGSLITARNALDIGREVMAVPGSPLDARAAGCNNLIRDGAVLIRNADDIHAALQPPTAHAAPPMATEPELPQPSAPTVGGLPEQILSLLSPTPLPEDIVIRNSGAQATQVMAILAELDINGKIERQPGGMVALATS